MLKNREKKDFIPYWTKEPIKSICKLDMTAPGYPAKQLTKCVMIGIAVISMIIGIAFWLLYFKPRFW